MRFWRPSGHPSPADFNPPSSVTVRFDTGDGWKLKPGDEITKPLRLDTRLLAIRVADDGTVEIEERQEP